MADRPDVLAQSHGPEGPDLPEGHQAVFTVDGVELDGQLRVRLNGRVIGPPVETEEQLRAAVQWFTGYLAEQVEAVMGHAGS